LLGIIQSEIQNLAGPLDEYAGRDIRFGELSGFKCHSDTVHIEYKSCQPPDRALM
jgi:hypothetical protein